MQGSAKTKEDAEKALQDTNNLENDVNNMMDQLSAAEQDLAKKKVEADADMMMAAMVPKLLQLPVSLCTVHISTPPSSASQASDNAKEAEDNARKAKNMVKKVLKVITDLLAQLGKMAS